MRSYRLTDLSNKVVDLDDGSIYSHLPDDYDSLFNLMCKEIGFALSYMDFIHRELFPLTSEQRIRVNELVDKFWKERREKKYFGGPESILWMREQVYVLQDEIENMC